LLVEAANGRFAVEATSVTEVAQPDANGESIRGYLELTDLSALLGGEPEARPGSGVVLDVSPTLAVRVKAILGVADVAREPFFGLPPGLGQSLSLWVRGAILREGRLYLELIAEALPHKPVKPPSPPPRPVYPLEYAPDRALVFESQGRLFGIPLPLVSQVVARSDAFCTLPAPSGPVAGLFPHAKSLWPVYSAPGLLGGPAKAEELLVLAELAGQNVGLSASRVLGVQRGFSATSTRGEFSCHALAGPALFLDLQHMFS
jgi:hypothetical protein